MALPSYPLTCLLFVFFGVAVNIQDADAARFTDCSNKKLLDSVDDVKVTCEPSTPSATFQWSLHPTGSSETILATCTGGVTGCSNDGRAKFTNDGTASTLTYSGITWEEAGKVKCKEGSQVAECDVQVVYVSASCGEKEEGSAFTVNCFTSTKTPSSVSIERTGSQADDVTCSDVGSCDDSGINDVTVDRVAGKMTYKIKDLTRQMQDDKMTCTFSYSGNDDSDKCAINVYHKAKIENCGLTINSRAWQGTLTCDFSQWWAGSGKYEYEITRSSGGSAVVDKTPVPAEALESYTADNKVFRRGRITSTFNLPADGSNKYLLSLHPGGESGPETAPSDGFEIESPSTPSLDCEEEFVAPLNLTIHACACQVTAIGKPAGRLAFKVGEVVVHWGDYGVSTLDFPSATYRCGGMGTVQVTCYVDWVQPKVAAGPAQTVSCLSTAYGIRSSWSIVVGGLLMVMLLLSLRSS